NQQQSAVQQCGVQSCECSPEPCLTDDKSQPCAGSVLASQIHVQYGPLIQTPLIPSGVLSNIPKSKIHCCICPLFRHMPKITKGSFSDSTLLKHFLHIPSNKTTGTAA
ncbi:hypothetical protein STEG23_034692, partial [Scotinomys teguina]